MKKKLVLIGPLPKRRIEGVSVCFSTLVAGLQEDNIVVVNSNWMRHVETPGRFQLLRAIESVFVILKAAFFLPRSRAVYLIVASSKWGFLRDAGIVMIASLFRRPVVAHLHGGGMRGFYVHRSRTFRRFVRHVYSRVSTVIVLGEGLRGQFRFVPKTTRITVVANGLPVDMEPTAKQDRTLESPLRLLYMSNITPSKGLADLIEALAIARRSADVELDICGAFLGDVDHSGSQSGDQFAAILEKRIDELQVRDAVIFHGTVSGAEKTEVFGNAHVLVLPTYYKWEGQPISIIEAQAWALPVVTTDHRAIGDSVIFGETAERCEPRNPTSIAQAIDKIVASPEIYARYAAAAYRNYREHFQMETHIRNMRGVIEAAATVPLSPSAVTE